MAKITLDLTSDEAEEILIAFEMRRKQLDKLRARPVDWSDLPGKLGEQFAKTFGWTNIPGNF